MKMHESLRPYVNSTDELYQLLQRWQARSFGVIGLRLLTMVALLATGLLVPGTVGSVAFCLAPVAGVACLYAIADNVARGWFMHLLTLHELIRPRYESTGVVMADWLRDVEEQGEA